MRRGVERERSAVEVERAHILLLVSRERAAQRARERLVEVCASTRETGRTLASERLSESTPTMCVLSMASLLLSQSLTAVCLKASY